MHRLPERACILLWMFGHRLYLGYTALGVWSWIEKGRVFGMDTIDMRPGDVLIAGNWCGVGVITILLSLFLLLTPISIPLYCALLLLIIVLTPLVAYLEIYLLLRKGAKSPSQVSP